MSNLILRNEENGSEMDHLLHDYFRSEMPHPWPAFKAPRQKPTISFWSRSAGRFAIAACIALLMLGYLTLGGFCPRLQGPSEMTKQGENMGMGEKKGPRPVQQLPKTAAPTGQTELQPVGTISGNKK